MQKSGKDLKGAGIGVFILFFVCMSCPALLLAGDNSRRGPAFIPSAGNITMSPEWEKQPIVHEDWAQGADIAASLDQHLYPALEESIRNYAEKNRIKIAVREGTCGVSGGALSKKTADITGYCCPPGKTDRLPGVQYHTVAIGALAMFVHPDNPIENITYEQAQKIYQGKITRWSELKTPDSKPGPDLPIKLIGRLHCKNRPGHWRNLLDNEDQFSPGLHEVGAIQDVMIQVALDPMAIGGFETFYMAYHVYPQKKPIKALKLNGVSPADLDALARGEYPLYFTYGFSTWDNFQDARTRKFVEFLIGQGDKIDGKFKMVPVAALRKKGWIFSGDELTGEPPR